MLDDTGPAPNLTGDLWRMLLGDDVVLAALELTGPKGILPSVFDVTGFAAATVGMATLAAAELLATREERAIRRVTVDRRRASAAFLAEHLFTPHGWSTPPFVDPTSGDYPTRDGWIRLHTAYPHHRVAACTVLGVPGEHDAVAPAVARWARVDLEAAVLDGGGCAAAMYTRDQWLTHPAGMVATTERAVAFTDPPSSSSAEAPPWSSRRAILPLDGIRVLDLTRAIAGPVCTQFLATYGAEVLRIDPPGYPEVPSLSPVTSAGKRVAALDLRDDADRRTFAALVEQADVVVSGLRPDALAGLGLGLADLAAGSPELLVVELDAYGWHGPWASRRGFDSLVQMSSGIAAAGAAALDSDAPRSLPAQALDHGTGYLLAAAVCRALTTRVATGTLPRVHGALVGTSNALVSTLDPDRPLRPPPSWDERDTVPVDTAWGPGRAVPPAGSIDGLEPAPLRPARAFGTEAARFA